MRAGFGWDVSVVRIKENPKLTQAQIAALVDSSDTDIVTGEQISL